MLAKAIWPTSVTVPGAQGPLSPCFKCGEDGHWAVACPNSHWSLWTYPKCYQEGYWSVSWLSPCTSWQGDIKHRLPSSWPRTTEGTGLSWPNHCHLWQLAPGWHHYIRMNHLLPLRRWCPRKFWGSTSCSPIVGRGGTTLSTSSDLTTQFHFQRYSSYSLSFGCASLPCSLTGKGTFSQIGSFYFFCFPYPSDSRLISSSSPPPSYLTYWIQYVSLPAKHTCMEHPKSLCYKTLFPHCHSIRGHRTLPKPSTYLHSKPLGDLNLSIWSPRENIYFILHPLLLMPLYLQLGNLTGSVV